MHDVGIVILEEPGVVGLDEYGTLPELDQFDDLPMPSGKRDKTMVYFCRLWPANNLYR